MFVSFFQVAFTLHFPDTFSLLNLTRGTFAPSVTLLFSFVTFWGTEVAVCLLSDKYPVFDGISVDGTVGVTVGAMVGF